ncbi:hypothetical protein BST61_g9399 [Cercospora zeina]
MWRHVPKIWKWILADTSLCLQQSEMEMRIIDKLPNIRAAFNLRIYNITLTQSLGATVTFQQPLKDIGSGRHHELQQILNMQQKGGFS